MAHIKNLRERLAAIRNMVVREDLSEAKDELWQLMQETQGPPGTVEDRFTEIPPDVLRFLLRWCLGKEVFPPGDFLMAVLEGNLAEAVIRADRTNLELLPVYVMWLHKMAPSASWGTKEKVQAWLFMTEDPELNHPIGLVSLT
jgi:hypothetical protein